MADPARAPWSRWAKLAAVASAKAADPEAKGYAYSKDVDHALLGVASTIAEELPENPVLQADVRALITLVMETAADSLGHAAGTRTSWGSSTSSTRRCALCPGARLGTRSRR